MQRAGQTPHGARPNREGFRRKLDACLLGAPQPPGRSLEPRSNAGPRGMTVPQHSCCGQNSAYRSGCHKIFLSNIPKTPHGTIPGVGDSACVPSSASAVPAAVSIKAVTQRHSALVRLTHWITTLCFLALLISGGEIVLSHPRFYWGETGNVNMRPWLNLHLPSSRDTVPTGYGYVLPDQNGWSRYLHFQTAWLLVGTGLLYVLFGFFARHFWRNLFSGGV